MTLTNEEAVRSVLEDHERLSPELSHLAKGLRALAPRTWRARLVALVLLLLASAALSLPNYMPLRTINESRSTTCMEGIDAIAPMSHEQFTVVRPSPDCGVGKTFSMLFPVHNTGPIPLSVQSLQFPNLNGITTGTRFTLVGPDMHDAEGVAFHPFTLGAGQQMYVRLSAVLACTSHGNGVTGSSVGITFRILGLIRHDELPLPYSYSISCP